MHVIEIPTAIEHAATGALSPGRYLIEDFNAADMMQLFRETELRVQHMQLAPTVNQLDYSPDGSLLIVHVGGFGDQLLLTPCLREIARLRPNRRLLISCFPQHEQVFYGLPYVDGFIPYPIPLEIIPTGCTTVSLESAHSRHADRNTLHMTDLYAAMLGLPDFADKKSELRLTKEELEWPEMMFAKNDKKRLAIQLQAGHQCRTYPAENVREVVERMLRKGWEVFLLGQRGEYYVKVQGNLHDLSDCNPTWRQSAAFLTTCDCVLGPDSSMIHAAGALGVPAVGLYGPFPWEIRTAYSPSILAVQGRGECAPCFHSSNPGKPIFPANGPCAQTGKCEVLAGISAERVVAKIESVSR